MAYREFDPPPDLAPVVRALWFMEEEHVPETEEHRFLPERAVRLTFYAGESYAETGDGMRRLPDAYLLGLHDAPVVGVSRGLTRALGADLYPWGAMQLFGLATVEDTLCRPARDAALARLGREVSGLLALGDPEGARAALVDGLRRAAHGTLREPGAAVRAASALYETRGAARVAELAQGVALSPRSLERRFRAEVGIAPKKLARLIRFEEAYNRLWLDPSHSLTELAHEMGYADSAHFTREFRALAHQSPSAYVRMLRARGDRGEAAALLAASLHEA